MTTSISSDQLGFAIDDSSVIVVDALPVDVGGSVHDALCGRDEGQRTQKCQTSDFPNYSRVGKCDKVHKASLRLEGKQYGQCGSRITL
jgi:hypothetical protein